MKSAVHVMGMDSSKYGGIERFNIALSKMLWQEGIQSVFIYESYPESEDFVDDLKQTGAELYVSNSRKHPFLFCIDFIKIILNFKPVLVHAHFTKARFYAIPLAKILGVKKLYFTIHSSIDPISKIKPLTRLWYGAANKMAKVIAVSNQIASTYKLNWPDARVKRIYMGVNKPDKNRNNSRKYLEVSDSQLMILTVANFNQIKGLDILVKALGRLVDQNRLDFNTCLYIVGQPEKDINELKTMIDSLELGHYIKMVGITNEVAHYMASADLYIQPSRSEGLPLALMEAASFSLPLIGSRVGGIPEIIIEGQNGFLIPPEDENMLAETIYEMMQNPDLRIILGNNSHSIYNESFSIGSAVRQTIDYYHS